MEYRISDINELASRATCALALIAAFESEPFVPPLVNDVIVALERLVAFTEQMVKEQLIASLREV